MKLKYFLVLVFCLFFSCSSEKKDNSITKTEKVLDFGSKFRNLNIPYSIKEDSAFGIYEQLRFNSLPFYMNNQYLLDDSALAFYCLQKDSISGDFQQSIFSFGKLQLSDSCTALLFASVFYAKSSESPDSASTEVDSEPRFISYKLVSYNKLNKKVGEFELGKASNSADGGILSYSSIEKNGKVKIYYKEEQQEEIDSSLINKNFSLFGLPVTKLKTVKVVEYTPSGIISQRGLDRDQDPIFYNSKKLKVEEFVSSILIDDTIKLNGTGSDFSSHYLNAWFAYSNEMARTLGLIQVDSLRYFLACTNQRSIKEVQLMDVFELPNSAVNAICLVHKVVGKSSKAKFIYEIYEYDALNNPGRLIFREDISDWVKSFGGTEKAKKLILDKLSKRM